MSAAYYAKGMEIWKSPVKTKKGDGTTSISIGFQCATATEAVGDEGAQAIAEMLTIADGSQARIADLEAENGMLRKALEGAFCVLLLDGRNEHGSHVLSGYPRSFEVSDEDLTEQAEAILCEGEKLGFPEGSLVWANFSWVPAQIGDEGRVELDGYWAFLGINPKLSKLLEAP